MAKENAVNRPVSAPPVPKKESPWLVDTGLRIGGRAVFVCSDDSSSAATVGVWHGSRDAHAAARCAVCCKDHPVCNLAEGLERSLIDTTEGGIAIEMGDYLAALLREKAAAG